MEDSGPQRNSGFPILPGELGVRFGCGAIVGLIMGFFAAAKYVRDPSWLELLGWMIGTAVLSGFLARAGGDDFWRKLRWWV
jgi:hypothetical protein